MPDARPRHTRRGTDAGSDSQPGVMHAKTSLVNMEGDSKRTTTPKQHVRPCLPTLPIARRLIRPLGDNGNDGPKTDSAACHAIHPIHPSIRNFPGCSLSLSLSLASKSLEPRVHDLLGCHTVPADPVVSSSISIGGGGGGGGGSWTTTSASSHHYRPLPPSLRRCAAIKKFSFVRRSQKNNGARCPLAHRKTPSRKHCQIRSRRVPRRTGQDRTGRGRLAAPALLCSLARPPFLFAPHRPHPATRTRANNQTTVPRFQKVGNRATFIILLNG
ncbi:hypothetical protein IWX47DRAFT_7968 [Phyllosticta citricarpa]